MCTRESVNWISDNWHVGCIILPHITKITFIFSCFYIRAAQHTVSPHFYMIGPDFVLLNSQEYDICKICVCWYLCWFTTLKKGTLSCELLCFTRLHLASPEELFPHQSMSSFLACAGHKPSLASQHDHLLLDLNPWWWVPLPPSFSEFFCRDSLLKMSVSEKFLEMQLSFFKLYG